MTVYSLDEVKERGLFPGFVGKFIHSENMTFVYWDVAEGSPLPAHSHPHEQVINMFEGQFEIRITDGETRVLGPGDVYVIPGGAEHSGQAITRCRILDVFQPVREEYVWED